MRQTGAAVRSSRLLWAMLSCFRGGAGTHVAGAREKDLHLHGDIGPSLCFPSPPEVFLVLCYVQLKTIRKEVSEATLNIWNLLFIARQELVAQSRLWELAFPMFEHIPMRCAGARLWAPCRRSVPVHSGIGWGGAAGDRQRTSVAHSHCALRPSHSQHSPGSSFAGCSSLNPTNCNSHRSHSCPFSPTVTACYMLYCSSPS